MENIKSQMDEGDGTELFKANNVARSEEIMHCKTCNWKGMRIEFLKHLRMKSICGAQYDVQALVSEQAQLKKIRKQQYDKMHYAKKIEAKKQYYQDRREEKQEYYRANKAKKIDYQSIYYNKNRDEKLEYKKE